MSSTLPLPPTLTPFPESKAPAIGLGFPSAFSNNHPSPFQQPPQQQKLPQPQQANIFAPKPVFPSAIPQSFSTFVTPIPTPIPTPPPPSVPVAQPIPSLSAAATAFTPSTTSQPPAAANPYAIFSVPFSAAAPAFIPKPVPPVFTPQSKPSFQFTPPPAPKPAFVPSLPQPAPISKPVLQPIKQSFPIIQPIVSSPLRRSVSKTPALANNSLKPKSVLNNSTNRKVSLSSPIHGPAREIMLNHFIKSIAKDLMTEAVHLPNTRIAEHALMDRWEDVRLAEKKLRSKVVDSETKKLAKWLVSQAADLGSLEAGFMAIKEIELKKEVIQNWRERTRVSIKNGEREMERRRKFEIVSREIGLGPNDAGEALVQELDFSSLNLGTQSTSLDVEMTDRKMVKSLRKVGFYYFRRTFFFADFCLL